MRRHLRGKRWRCKSQPCKRKNEPNDTPLRTNAARIRLYKPCCRSLRNGHNTNTRRLSAVDVAESRAPPRTTLNVLSVSLAPP
jgi:hypothetical protein